jgi:hypothetical protein
MGVVYGLTWPHDGTGDVAQAPKNWWLPKLGDRPLLREWSAPTFTVDGALVDLQPNDAGIMLLSSTMRTKIELARSPSDRVEWLPVNILHNGQVSDYAIPHLLDELDAVDKARSVLNTTTGEVIRAQLRAEAIGEHHVFTYSNDTGLIILFSEKAYEELKTCTGCSFSTIKVTPRPRA